MIEPRRLAPLMAALGAMLLLNRLLGLWAIPGLDLGTAPGRARTLLAILSVPAVPLLADVFLIGAAVISGRGGLRRSLGGVHVIAGILLLLAVPVFWFASARVVESLGPQAVTSFRLQVIRVLILLAGLGVGALATGRILLGMDRR